jgi:hypothetical protein
LFARASAKDRLLESFGLKNPCLQSANLTETQLLHWYFEELLGRPVPDDPNRYLRSLGFASPDAFRRVLLKEYLYRHLEPQDTKKKRESHFNNEQKHDPLQLRNGQVDAEP